jgi:steroid delta-isomerase-like uncharacterized protein
VSGGDLSTLDAICAQCPPQFVITRGVVEPPPQGISGLKNLVTTFRTAFPDFHVTVEDQLAEGDKVASHLTVRGTHRGEIFGIPSTGKSFTVSGISIWEVQNGLLVSEWVNWDTLEVLQQLGVMPALGQAS